MTDAETPMISRTQLDILRRLRSCRKANGYGVVEADLAQFTDNPQWELHQLERKGLVVEREDGWYDTCTWNIRVGQQPTPLAVR